MIGYDGSVIESLLDLDCGHLGKQGEDLQYLQISLENIVGQLCIMANVGGNMMGKLLHELGTNTYCGMNMGNDLDMRST